MRDFQELHINMSKKCIEHIHVLFQQKMIYLACGIIMHHLERVLV